jgi:hypothetical protein
MVDFTLHKKGKIFVKKCHKKLVGQHKNLQNTPIPVFTCCEHRKSKKTHFIIIFGSCVTKTNTNLG